MIEVELKEELKNKEKILKENSEINKNLIQENEKINEEILLLKQENEGKEK